MTPVRLKGAQEKLMPLPILYSLQHCPYAMRARMGLLLAEQAVMIRAVVTKNKPAEMLIASPKGSVPVLVLDKKTVIDESLDIMIWALHKNDPHNLLYSEDSNALPAMLQLIKQNDNEFTDSLSKYKRAKRYHESSEIHNRQQCEVFIHQLETRLNTYRFFMGHEPSLADYAILPFIRQFARVDRKWYLQSSYPKLQQWLNAHLQSSLFSKIMKKYPLWLDQQEAFLFAGETDSY